MIAKPHNPNGLDAESAVVAALGEVADIWSVTVLADPQRTN